MTRRSCFFSVLIIIFALFHCTSPLPAQVRPDSLKQDQVPAVLLIDAPTLALAGIPFDLTARAVAENGRLRLDFSGPAEVQGVILAPESAAPRFMNGELHLQNLRFGHSGRQQVQVQSKGASAQHSMRVIPGILSILPPLLAILLAFIFRQVLLSLFLGIWLGAVFLFDYSLLQGFLRTLDKYLIESLANPDHAAIIMFSLTLGGMVGVISRGGGMRGIVESVRKFANHPRGGQLATWFMGVLIFFDDYANTLLVGNTMRPFTDKLNISREKLSYIVDSTAAPVASAALISTWIGYQVGLIDQAFETAAIQKDAYFEFVRSVPFTFYSLLAIVMVFIIGATLRDFGPMLKAERRAAGTGKVLGDNAQPLMDTQAAGLEAEKDTPARWYNGLVPILTVIAVTMAGLYYSGQIALGEQAAAANLRDIISAANSFSVLMWASFAGLFVAAVMVMAQRILGLQQTVDALIGGYRSMILAAMILVLAWGIGAICKDLQTANYVIEFSRGFLSAHYLPALAFVISAFIAFSTGTSWATMAIFIPIAIPMAHALPLEQGVSAVAADNILLATIGSVLSGSVFGDHCSPISDTTILSSMASGSDHIDHVRTQLPYALVAALVAIVFGYLPAGFGLHPAISLTASTLALVGFIYIFGKKIPERGK